MSEQTVTNKECIGIPIFMVDAFTNVAFEGNSAAVCLLKYDLNLKTEEMQNIAKEMNLSETVFIKILEEDGSFESSNTFNLRWFTPTTEVSLCGHATLASAAVLFYEAGNNSEEIKFTTLSGELIVQRNQQNFLSLNFPSNPPQILNTEDVKELLQLCVEDVSLIEDVQLSATGKLLLCLKDSITREQVEKLKPRVNEMVGSCPGGLVKGVGITVKGSAVNGCVDQKGRVYDFISRYFAPWLGISEDPVTGSWHTVAGPYWSKKLNKTDLYARQCSARGGDLWLNILNNRVEILGEAVVNLRGTFSLVIY